MSGAHSSLTTARAPSEKAPVPAIRRILCPVDFSDGSQRALEQAAAIARRWGAPVTLLHVYQAASPFNGFSAGNRTSVDDPQLSTLNVALRKFAQPTAEGVTLAFRLRQGADARRAILAELEASDADLLVLGTHPRGTLEQLLVGSITEGVVRGSCCPVLAVPPAARPAADGRFRQILCAIDFSLPSVRAFRYAIRLASSEDAEIRLLHAIEMPAELRDRQIAAAFDVDAVRAAATAAARQRLEALAPPDDAPALRIASDVVDGQPHRRILEMAHEHDSDLIVLGMHGRNVIDRWLFGSNTCAVLRDATCPVLTVGPE